MSSSVLAAATCNNRAERVKNSSHHDIIPLKQYPTWRRWDTLPFAVAYLALVAIDSLLVNIGVVVDALYPLLLVLQVGLFVLLKWRERARAWIGYNSRTKTLEEWTHCLVIPPNNSRVEIVPVVHQHNAMTIKYHDIVFRYSLIEQSMWGQTRNRETKGQGRFFCRLQFPTDLSLSFYQQWRGHGSDDVAEETRRVFGDNRMEVTLPPFLTLLSQQLVAPFFLFQVFCVALWSLDEYWYYAIFTLATLVVFECTVTLNRLKSLQRLRDTSRPPYPIWCWRAQRWTLTKCDALVAGDVVSLTASNEVDGGLHVPADLLLLRGRAVVNEAMLTGESVPQIKESIDIVASSAAASHDDTFLDMEDLDHKRAVLFGGTVLVNHYSSDTDSSSGNDTNKEEPFIPTPPDGGCTLFVLKTGFETQQGTLLRTMIYSGDNSDGVNTVDTFLFVLLLLFWALLSSVFILHHSWRDPTRNRFKLLLHVVIILTSVVPPELPMELSLAVLASVSDLITRCNVYCTEPYRIPVAGKVDVCAFDKTGTLTSDEMVFCGVRLPTTGVNGHIRISCKSGTVGRDNEDLILPWTGKNTDILDEDKSSSERKNLISTEVMRVLVGCQSLSMNHIPVKNNNQLPKHCISSSYYNHILGDPLEKAVLRKCQWMLTSTSNVSPPPSLMSSSYKPICIRHRFAFTSKLKRMTVLAHDLNSPKAWWVLTKGAPETLQHLFRPSSLPDNYEEIYKHHQSLGQRVLALGYKQLDSTTTKIRSTVECDLVFGGFMVLECPLKSDSVWVIAELKRSDHKVVMITGDAVLTAAEVARQVGIIDTRSSGNMGTYELRELQRSGEDDSFTETDLLKFEFVPLCSEPKRSNMAYTPSNLFLLKSLRINSQISLCVTGDVLTKIAIDAVRQSFREEQQKTLHCKRQNWKEMDDIALIFHPAAQKELKTLVPLISVFARHSPRQKEAVIAALNAAGHVTLMCGDGTNDVGALKMAHVGISIISVPDLEAKQREAMKGVEKERRDYKKARRGANVTKSTNATTSKKQARSSPALQKAHRALAEAEKELAYVALGDASMASPFTSRTMSIRCTKDVLQRGRCTLVTMLQIYKILGVNCLVNALVLSVLHMVGAKQGDRQLTAVGVVVAILFYFVTKGKPLESLSPKRPSSSVLSAQALLSIAVQFCIHLVFLMAVTLLSKSYLDPYDPSLLVPDGPFHPNVLNTATFLVSVLATVNTFVVNYRGRPFMEDLSENKVLVRILQACYGILFACVLEIFPPLNDLLQLAPMPAGITGEEELILNEETDFILTVRSCVSVVGFRGVLCLLMSLNSVIAYQAEKSIVWHFEGI